MITVKAKLSKRQFTELCATIHERFPSAVGWTQAINECESGIFRLVNIRGGRIPEGLTAAVVESMIATIQPADTSHLAHLWADRVGAAYARRMR